MKSSQLNNFSDLELIAQYKQTNNNEFVGALFQRHTHLIFGVCLKYLKEEEEAQDASIVIFEKLLVELQKHEVQQFKSWLHSVCKNFCIMKLRTETAQGKHIKKMYADFDGIMESTVELHLTIEDRKEMQLTYMEECMKGLNKEQKMCLELFYLKEKSYHEVTELTSFSMNNVKSYIQNGKRNLKTCIETRSRSVE